MSEIEFSDFLGDFIVNMKECNTSIIECSKAINECSQSIKECTCTIKWLSVDVKACIDSKSGFFKPEIVDDEMLNVLSKDMVDHSRVVGGV